MTAAAPAHSRTPLKILLCAVEPSGDALGADLMIALREKLHNNVEFIGCGGPQMMQGGLTSLFSIEPFSVVGPLDALKAVPEALKGADILAEATAREKPDCAVLIDGWAFCRIAAARIKKKRPETQLIKYVAPQVWASRPQRVKTLARLFDGVLTLFSFENDWFRDQQLASRFVGNSTFQKAASVESNPTTFRQREGLGQSPLLAVLPGSRKGEVRRLLPPFCETIDRLRIEIPDLKVAIPVAPAVEADVRRLTANWQSAPIFVEANDRYDVFAAADAAIVASGTATTELAIFQTPMIVAYKVGPLSAFWFRNVITTPYVTLLNIVARAEVVPEYLQDACRPSEMADALLPLLRDTPSRQAQLDAFPTLLSALGVGGPPAAESAAKAILDWIGQKKLPQDRENPTSTGLPIESDGRTA